MDKVTESEVISWEASEFLHHEKDALWYGGFAVVTALLMGGMYLLLEDVFGVVIIGLMAVTIIVFANRKPRSLKYQIDDQGIKIGDHGYTYESFRSFSLMHDGTMDYIMLEPLTRYMPPISVYYDPEQQDQIIQALATFLPHQDREPDFIDRLFQRIRF